MRLISRILAPVALSSLMACGSGGGGGGGGGGTAPTVVSTSPANGAISIAVSAGVTVTFSEAMDCSTITSASFFVELGGTLAPGTIACAGTTATLTPSPALSAGSTYTATVQAGVKSTTALALAQSVTWSFTTAASSVPPTVVSTVPASGATNVAISAGLTVTFSEAMDCTTITSTSFFEALGGTPTPGTIACGGSQATFTPSASLSLAATYTATVQAGVKSTNGLALAASVTWSFSTEAVVPSCGGDSGKIYVADFANDRVVRMDDMCGDNWTTLDDSNDGVLAELNEEGVSVDSAGKIYIADTFNNRIVRVDDMTGANPVTYSGLSTSLFSAPRTVVVDAAGHIYVTDGFDFPRIVRMDDMTGTGWTVYPPAGTLTSPFKGLWGLFVDSMNRIYVVDNDGSNYSVGRVVRMDDMTGANLVSFGTYGTGTNQFAFPWGVSVDSTFHIYVADASNSRIVRINDMTGAGWTTLGTLGTGVGQFYDPVGIFVDGTGHIYVADYGGSLGYGADDHIVRMDDMTGTNWTTLGSEGAEVKEFDGASSVWVH